MDLTTPSALFGALWVGSEFVLDGKTMHKVGNLFAMPISQPRFGSGGVGWPVDVKKSVQLTPKSALKASSPNPLS